LNVSSILSKGQADLLVTHGPYTTFYVEALGRRGRTEVPHLAFAFNFTDFPTGVRFAAMRRTFSSVDRFVVFSKIERALYAERLQIPEDRFTFVRWGVSQPIDTPSAARIPRPYVVALGGEARDYGTACEAARRLPRVPFVLVVRPNSLNGINIPDNVTVHVNLPRQEAWSLAWHAELMLLPLRSGRSPNGLVTLVGGMHLGKAQVATDSLGLSDYARNGENALLVPVHDAPAFADAIAELLENPLLRNELGAAAREFAREHCSERLTIEAFRRIATEMTSNPACID
jgi:glycosyltransferase involved in cell wall biosynthesis